MTNPQDGSLCVKCKKNPKEYNNYCYSCAVEIIANFKESQIREIQCDIRAKEIIKKYD